MMCQCGRSDGNGYEKVGLDRLFSPISSSVRVVGRHACLIFDEDKEAIITRAYRRFRILNPMPSRYDSLGGGREDKEYPR